MAAIQMSKPAKFIQETLARNRVVVFSKINCPISRKCVGDLGSVNVQPVVHEVDKSSALQQELQKKSGDSSMPQIFISGRYFGNASLLEHMRTAGTIKASLARAGARFQ